MFLLADLMHQHHPDVPTVRSRPVTHLPEFRWKRPSMSHGASLRKPVFKVSAGSADRMDPTSVAHFQRSVNRGGVPSGKSGRTDQFLLLSLGRGLPPINPPATIC